jgi:hypothetical protein
MHRARRCAWLAAAALAAAPAARADGCLGKVRRQGAAFAEGSARPQTGDPALSDLNERITFVVEGE